MVTLLEDVDLPAVAGIEVLGRGDGWVVTRSDETPVNPSREVLAAIGKRATTRTVGTITRLCRALGLSSGS
ncbi:MAG TPA: hypothetical protein PKM36_06390 [Propionibacteriaceae bacterium]|nr:hypothetical protein [Propionibacteriaceae bacterium]